MILLLSGGRSGVREGDGSSNRRSAVYRLGRYLPRHRFCTSSTVGGGARVSPPVAVGGASSIGGDGSLRPQIKFFVGGTTSDWNPGGLGTNLRQFEAFVPLLFSDGAAAAGVLGVGGLRLGLVLLAKGWNLLCSFVSFPLRVGDGTSSGVLFRSLDSFLVMVDRWLSSNASLLLFL